MVYGIFSYVSVVRMYEYDWIKIKLSQDKYMNMIELRLSFVRISKCNWIIKTDDDIRVNWDQLTVVLKRESK